MNARQDACPFCAIVRREAPARLVFEDDDAIAFLDRRPLFAGHTLVVPRAHHETLGDLPDTDVAPLFRSVRLLARAVEEALDAHGTHVALNNRVSQSVPHLHVHVVPRRRKDGLRGFFWPRTTYRDDAEAERVRAQVAEAVERLRSA